MSRKLFFLWLVMVVVFGVHLDSLSQRIVRTEIELKAMRGISSELFAVRSKTTAIQSILSHEDFTKRRRIRVFKSTQDVDGVDDALISNAPGQADYNWGASHRVGAGYDGNDNIYRTLIKFNEFKKAIPEGTEILAATVYLKQVDNGRDDEGALREIFELWEVEKNWGEGSKKKSRAEFGEVTWNAATDVKKNILMATTGPNVNDGGKDWVAFCFTPPGIVRLEQRLRNKTESDDGFLIQLENGLKKKNTFVSFYSSDDPSGSYRPYIEIIYMDAGH